MLNLNPLDTRAVKGLTACVAPRESQECVRKTRLVTESVVRPAKVLESGLIMRGKPVEMPIQGGLSIRRISSMRKRTALFGSIVSSNMVKKKQSFIMKALRNFTSCLQQQVRITASKASIVMNSKNEWHQAPIIRVVASSGLHADQGEDQALAPAIPMRGGGAGRGRGRGSS